MGPSPQFAQGVGAKSEARLGLPSVLASNLSLLLGRDRLPPINQGAHRALGAPRRCEVREKVQSGPLGEGEEFVVQTRAENSSFTKQ